VSFNYSNESRLTQDREIAWITSIFFDLTSFTLSLNREQSFYALWRCGGPITPTGITIRRRILDTKVLASNIQHLDSAYKLVGAEAIGRIETDMTCLIDEGKIEPQFSKDPSTHAGSNEKHWKAHYELVMTVDGCSICFETKWPARRHLQPEQAQRDLGRTLVSVAASIPIRHCTAIFASYPSPLGLSTFGA
jgi:hypothetical protein